MSETHGVILGNSKYNSVQTFADSVVLSSSCVHMCVCMHLLVCVCLFMRLIYSVGVCVCVRVLNAQDLMMRDLWRQAALLRVQPASPTCAPQLVDRCQFRWHS
mmetsp:Transcript_79223/g.128384  ORF Transcript_79223/g.128384 Transcript_79223/m.128384 type:complete len:103 (-) Transcript_79223:639-947(-)